MHSRKTRINDGYYETQSRSFQNSKYNNSSSSSSRYSNYYRDRDTSPKRVAHRSQSPETSPRSSRDRYHHQSSSYRSKDRDRDYKKEKYSSDKRCRDRELEYNKNYKKVKLARDRSSSEEDHKESDRVYEKTRYADREHNIVRRGIEKERRFGDWKEMISKGSGKKYYYNERDKSSQWDKPEEWVDYEMKEYRGYREKERDKKSRDDRYVRNYNSSSSKHSRASSRSRWPAHESYPASSSGHHKRHEENADMEISDSTPTSEPSYSSPTANQHATSNNSNVNSNSLNHDDAMTSPNGHLTKHSLNTINSNNQFHHQISNVSSSSLNSNSKTNSNSNKNSTITSSASPSTHNYQSHHHRNRSLSPNDSERTSTATSATHNNVGGHETSLLHHNSNSSLRNSPSYSGGGNNSNALATGINSSSVSRLELNNSNNTNHLISDGPPTPELDLNSGEHRRLEATSGVSSLQSVLSVSQVSNRLNLLTPSLAKFFRADLITHVTNWPSEVLEKQAQKCAEEVYLLGDLECSKISAEIQCARSIVRVAEIAATIQTQRRLFLQDQIKSLDESQTQNSSTMSY